MQQYHAMLKAVLEQGTLKKNRTGVDTLSIFGYQARFNLQAGFPLVTTKRVHWKAVVHELLWFISGSTNISYLHKHGVTIWDEWAHKDGDLGPIYGKQWRSWERPGGGHIDQLQDVIKDIKERPDSRRHIVTAWNPGDLDRMALPPCHCMFQFYVADGFLSCQLYQRSADLFLGVPFNIASYALLTHMVADLTGLRPGFFVHTFGDLHLYTNHMQQAQLQLQRSPRLLPKLVLNPYIDDITEYEAADISLWGYDPHPPIKAPVAV